jgi:RNA polymerase sigma-70 factor (ECF subfamily)
MPCVDEGRSVSDLAERFELLLLPVLNRSYTLALSLARNRSDAENLVQEASLRAFRSFGSYAEGTNFRAWFMRILTNCFLEECRRKKSRPTAVDIDDEIEDAEPADSLVTNPALNLLSKLDGEQIAAAIRALPEELRAAAALYFVEGFSYTELAEQLNCPLGTIRSRLHRSRKWLKQKLHALASEQGLI